jgi:hypothetical protein
MNFRVNCQLEYTLNSPATFFFAVRGVAAGGQHILSETLITEPFVQAEEFTIAGGMSRITRIRTLNPGTLSLSYQADVSTSHRIVPVGSIAHDGPAGLSPDAVPLLFPSRYCQSDRLRHHAQDLFGHLNHPYEIAAAASDWIYENIAYVGGSSGETCSAMDTFETRSGVCRDFAHLGIAFCRAMNVPARYISCYACLLNPRISMPASRSSWMAGGMPSMPHTSPRSTGSSASPPGAMRRTPRSARFSATPN